ncbi:MAG: S41 family peptidase, partial [Pseudomonadales bacterium]
MKATVLFLALAISALPLAAAQVAEDVDATGEQLDVESLQAEALQQEETPQEETLQPRLPLDELRIFAEAFNRISSAYVEEINDQQLLEKAIRGMLTELDPHSTYLDQKSFSNLQETTTGNYGGLGLEVNMEGGFVKVISPMDDTPADRAGLESGDLIIQLDGMPVQGMNFSDALDKMRGEPGSDITMTVMKAGASTPSEITLTREVITIASVRHRLLEDGYGYIRIALFQTGTGPEVA